MPDFNFLANLFPLLQQIQQGQGIPSLTGIMNQPVTPPFAGGQIPGLPPQGNPYDVLNAVLNNLSQQPLQQAPQPGKVQSILDALQGGIAVALSKDPSQVLNQQLQGREQKRLLQTQQLQQRQNVLDQARLQIGIQQANDLAREQSQYREEQRRDLTEEKKFQRNRVAALEDLKKTGIVNQELADLEGARALKFYKDNKATILSRAEDEAYVRSLPERDQKALMLSTQWKELSPSSDSVMLNELAKKVLRGNEQLKPIERQLYNRLEGLVAEEESTEKELKRQRQRADISVQEAVAEATRTGQRYAGQQDRYRNAFDAQQGAEASRITSDVFMRNSKGLILDSDKVKTLPTVEQLDFVALPEDQQVIERAKRFSENAARNKRIETQQNVQGTTDATTIDLANDAAGSKIAEIFASKGLAEARNIILTSNAPQQEKLRLLQLLEKLSGQKQTIGAPNLAPTPKLAPSSSNVPSVSNPRGSLKNQ